MAIAREMNASFELCRSMTNLASCVWSVQGELLRAAALYEEAAETATRFGQAAETRHLLGSAVEAHYPLGEWDKALSAAEVFIAAVEAGSPHYQATICYA